MELKYDSIIDGKVLASVLIVPLWNWNSIKLYKGVNDYSFNCTFMELKSPFDTEKQELQGGFNCTFMELKYIWFSRYLVIIMF